MKLMNHFDSMLAIANRIAKTCLEKITEGKASSPVEHSTDAVKAASEAVEIIEKMVIYNNELATYGKEKLAAEIASNLSLTVGKLYTLLEKDTKHQPWLNQERKKNQRYWKRYAEYLESKVSLNAISDLDSTTDEILGLLEDPTRDGEWDRRGLVVGHVQSGKTSNYTGLICKAADAGYKIIIILAGLHNNLRAQTQLRLDECFLGYSTDPMSQNSISTIGVGKIDSDPAIRPNAVTNCSDKGDFNTKVASSMFVNPEQRPWLFVIKKNKTVLEKLLKWIQNFVADKSDSQTGRKIVSSLPLLMIDDESDHGSVDIGEDVVDEFDQPNLEHEPRTLNRLIRAILFSFSKKAYIGYTATPFANVFIHDRAETDSYGPDLFPCSFIANLSPPSNYIGPEQIFITNNSDEEEYTPPPLVRHLIDEDYQEWIPTRSSVNTKAHKNGHLPLWKGTPEIPDSLKEAIRSFILACAIRKLRGQGSKHSSMLVHVTRFTTTQAEIKKQVLSYVTALKNRLIYNIDAEDLLSVFESDYKNDFQPRMLSAQSTYQSNGEFTNFNWHDIRQELTNIVGDISVREINGSANDALDYSKNENLGLKVIAIGGDKLSRGLTLEGLCTSYFLRTSRMYDSLMQMGRWFGYRDNYIDLCRLYTTEEMTDWFTHITEASNELREEFNNMAASGSEPNQFGLRVKSHPVLTVTSHAKMRNAKPLQITYAGNLIQTIVFSTDKDIVSKNLRATERLICNLAPPMDLNKQHHITGNTNWNGHLWRNVPSIEIINFLHEYTTHEASFNTNSSMIANFIHEMNIDKELTSWTIALIGKDKDIDSENLYSISNLDISLLNRKSSSSQSGKYSIKTLISPRDQAIDLTLKEWEAALELTRKSSTDPQGVKLPGGPQIRQILGVGSAEHGIPPQPDKGLLMLYLLDPKGSKVDEMSNSEPISAWAIRFPNSNSARTVSNETYIASSVYLRNINEGF